LSFNLSAINETPYVLVVCEKPQAAHRIAQALGTSSFKKISGAYRARRAQPSVYSVADDNNRHFVICSAIGHLYQLVDPEANRSRYPIFEAKWMPKEKMKDVLGQKISIKYEQIIKTISLLSKKAIGFVHACDYDQEGEVIGYNILEYACNNRYKSSLRAKFSTLTDDEIRNSFRNLLKPSKGLARAGRCRHLLDFIYGINLSRALTQSFISGNYNTNYCTLTMGRVQGPALAFVVDREKDIRNHTPVPYWSIYGDFEKSGHIINAYYNKQKIMSLSEASSIVNACKDKDGHIIELKNESMSISPPYPFNIGDLQKEAFIEFKFAPTYTLTLAEKLYLNALISYPRTSSQKLPPTINYRKVLSGIAEVSIGNNAKTKTAVGISGNPYRRLVIDLLSKSKLFPYEGTKTDPAHPAIYPTGEKPKVKLDPSMFKLFDLIIRRFLATFGRPAISSRTTATIRVNDMHLFKVHARKITYEGWIYFYKPYIHFTELGIKTQLPDMKAGDVLKNIRISKIQRFTKPPKRFNQATLLEEMEKEKIGTKTTRSDIIAILMKRNYISDTTTKQNNGLSEGTGIEATVIGSQVIQTMRKYIPDLISTSLTTSMEEDLEQIEIGKSKCSVLIKHAIDKLKQAIVPFKANEFEIGTQLIEAFKTTKTQQQGTLGRCPLCGIGDLTIVRSTINGKRFVGCSNYRPGKCKATTSLPLKGSIVIKGKKCAVCLWPMVQVPRSGQTKHNRRLCINFRCPSKGQYKKL
jgi:DNA topoisomerase I